MLPRTLATLLPLLAACFPTVELAPDQQPSLDDTGSGGDGGGDEGGDDGGSGDGDDSGDDGGAEAGQLELSISEVDEGIVFLGQTATTDFTLSNVGEGPAEGLLALDEGAAAGWELSDSGGELGPDEQSEHQLVFSPTAWGSYSGQLLVSDVLAGESTEVPLVAEVQEDQDGDGVGSLASGGDDCDDLDEASYPGASDVWYDGLDSDCGGEDDFDQDLDGHLHPLGGGGDCDDTDAGVNPEASDVWYDGVDSDCDGADDYDADGDGYQSAVYTGEDCDDTDASVNPFSLETWYDGVDSDCSGTSDYDADGDGYDADDHGGDDCDDASSSVNPGATDTWYDGVDSDCDGSSDYDADGDGFDSEDHGGADCDDTDASVGEPEDESLNGLDDDCDGSFDELDIGSAASGVVYGYETDMAVGEAGGLAMSDDIDGDGAVDLVVVTAESNNGVAWLLDGATAAAASDDLDAVDSALLEGVHAAYALVHVATPTGDIDGDGVAELLVGSATTTSAYPGYGRAYLYFGSSSLGGTLDIDDYDAHFTGDNRSDNLTRAAIGDIDGDGYGEVVTGARYESEKSTNVYCGGVSVFAGPTFTGAIDIDDATDHIVGSSSYDYLGSSLVLSDLDADGYTDVIAGAPGDDDDGSDAGAVYLIWGNAKLSWSKKADDVTATKITGGAAGIELGTDTIATPGDVDGDGDLDLLLRSEDTGSAWLFLSAGGLGDTDLSSADHTFSGTAGDFASAAAIDSDLDGDGADDIALGGDSSDISSTNSGVVYLFRYSSGWGGSLGISDADATIWGDASSDYLGSDLAGGQDLDGDGIEDLAVGAVGVDGGATGGGAIYIIPGW